jgi:hypothetical protein
MRKSVVSQGVPYIFFVTTHATRARVLTGMYRVRWYAPGPDRDFALAADAYRFVDPIRIDGLPADLRHALSLRRGYKGVEEADAERIADLLQGKPSMNERYLDEIARVELLSERRTGFRYPTWERTDGWSWADAETYLAAPTVAESRIVPNRSPGDIWRCTSCAEWIVNKARLKRCPRCGAIATLRPLTPEE